MKALPICFFLGVENKTSKITGDFFPKNSRLLFFFFVVTFGTKQLRSIDPLVVEEILKKQDPFPFFWSFEF